MGYDELSLVNVFEVYQSQLAISCPPPVIAAACKIILLRFNLWSVSLGLDCFDSRSNILQLSPSGPICNADDSPGV